MALQVDPERKRQAGHAGRKSPKNQARYYTNLVAETAAMYPALVFTTVELLEAAMLVAVREAK